jgi:hypothetical protein
LTVRGNRVAMDAHPGGIIGPSAVAPELHARAPRMWFVRFRQAWKRVESVVGEPDAVRLRPRNPGECRIAGGRTVPGGHESEPQVLVARAAQIEPETAIRARE